MAVQEYLQLIRSKRDDWSDEIPEEILHSTKFVDGVQTNPKYKCRKGWFHLVMNLLEFGMMESFIDERTRELSTEFRAYCRKTNLQDRDLVWKYDIERGNEVLTSLIEHLENR